MCSSHRKLHTIKLIYSEIELFKNLQFMLKIKDKYILSLINCGTDYYFVNSLLKLICSRIELLIIYSLYQNYQRNTDILH
jgi:hypothetical protein